MIETIERWLQTDTTPAQDQKRLGDLNKRLGFNLEKVGFKLDYLYIIKTYEDHKKSGLYPNGQGYDFQSQALLDDFDMCALLEERAILQRKLKITPPVNNPPLPTFKFPAQR